MAQQYPPQYPQYPPQYPPGYPPPSPQTSGTAIVSLLASISAFFLFPIIGSIVGIIAGNSAKNDIRNRPYQVSGEGLAQAGIVIGWIGLGIDLLACCAIVAMMAMGMAVPGIGICAGLGSSNTFTP